MKAVVEQCDQRLFGQKEVLKKRLEEALEGGECSDLVWDVLSAEQVGLNQAFFSAQGKALSARLKACGVERNLAFCMAQDALFFRADVELGQICLPKDFFLLLEGGVLPDRSQRDGLCAWIYQAISTGEASRLPELDVYLYDLAKFFKEGGVLYASEEDGVDWEVIFTVQCLGSVCALRMKALSEVDAWGDAALHLFSSERSFEERYVLYDLVRKSFLLMGDEAEVYHAFLWTELVFLVGMDPPERAEDRFYWMCSLTALRAVLTGMPFDLGGQRSLPFAGYFDPLTWLEAHGVKTSVPLELRGPSPLPGLVRRQGEKVSILMALRDVAHFLLPTLASVRQQSHDHWELLIVDGDSSDETLALARAWAARDSRIQVKEQENKGLAGARNEALVLASGKYVHCLDGDDFIDPDFYVRMISRLENSDVEGLCCAVASAKKFSDQATVFLDSPVPGPDRLTFPGFVQSCTIPCHSVVFERSLLDRTGGFDEVIYTCEDWDLWLRFARCGVSFLRVPEALCWYRIVPSGSLSRNYVPYNNAVCDLLQRTMQVDDRCSIADMEGAPAEELASWQGIVSFWRENLRRAATLEDVEALDALYAWARETLPENFWTASDKYMKHFIFRVTDDVAGGGEVFSLRRLCVYTQGLFEGWQGGVPSAYVKASYDSLSYELVRGPASQYFSERRVVLKLLGLSEARKALGLQWSLSLLFMVFFPGVLRLIK